jgi:hypothetical protein
MGRDTPFTRQAGHLLNTEPVTSLTSFLQLTRVLKVNWSCGCLWFRGVERASYRLVPSIYREDLWDYWTYDPEEANMMFDGFVLRAKSYFGQVRRDYSPWEWYQLMQHYGVPTRLLDWTEGALIALYFALRNVSRIQTASVWAMEPYWLNHRSIGREELLYSDSACQTPVDEVANLYVRDGDELPEFPIAVIPPYIDERLRVQKSCFTCHGVDKDGIAAIAAQDSDAHLAQIRVSDESAESIKDDVIGAGISESLLFPGLEGLARELAYEFGFHTVPFCPSSAAEQADSRDACSSPSVGE